MSLDFSQWCGYNFRNAFTGTTDGTNEIGRMDAGLFFIGFVRDPGTQFVPIQLAMTRNDALMEYIRFTQSSIFAVPPGLNGHDHLGQALFTRRPRCVEKVQSD